MNEEEMIRLIRLGGAPSKEGLKALYQTYATAIQRFCVAQGADRADAEDIWQQIVIKIVKSADSFHGDGKASAWIWQIARNTLLDHLASSNKKETREQTVSEEAWSQISATATDDDAADRRRSLAVDDCVSQGVGAFAKAEPERAYALMLQMDGHSVEAIGERLGRSANATKQYLYEVRKKIAPYLNHCFDLLTPENS